MRTLVSCVLVAGCVALGWLVYATSADDVVPPKAEVTKALPVEIAPVETRRLEDRVHLVGSLEANSQVTIRARVNGYITRLPFDVGDQVRSDEGVVLVELEGKQIQKLVAKAEAALQVAEARQKAKEAQVDLAQKLVDREEILLKRAAVTEQQIDETRAQLSIAEAEVLLERAQVEEARLERDRVKLLLEETRILPPPDFVGYVAERLVDVGDLANPDDPLLTVVDISKVRTMVNVVERDYEKIQLGQLATITVDAFPDRVFQGVVHRKSPVLNPLTRTGAVHIEIPNDQGLLKPGMHARVSIVSNKRPATRVVPVTAVIEHEQKPAVYVVAGDPPTARLQTVETGIRSGQYVEVLSGVCTTDQVVTLGSRMIVDGQPVKPMPTPPAQNPLRETGSAE